MKETQSFANDPPSPVASNRFDHSVWLRAQYQSAFMTLLTTLGCCMLLAAPAYLPARIALILMSVGPAIYMTAFLYLYPDSLRTRSGSLRLAICLVAALWISGIGMTTASLFGAI